MIKEKKLPSIILNVVSNLEIKNITLSGSRVGDVCDIKLDHINFRNLICFKVVNDDAWLLYKRLGHASTYIIDKLSKHNLVRGIPKHKHNKDQICCARVKGNQARASFKPLLIVSTTRPLELLHMDLCVPIRLSMLAVLSMYSLLFDYFRFTCAFFLKNKILLKC